MEKYSRFQLQVRKFNRSVSMRALLVEAGLIHGTENSMFCPFHPDSMTGHRSAAIRDEGNVLFCFSERKTFRPYDLVRKLGKRMEDFIHLAGEDQVIEDKLPPAYSVEESQFNEVLTGKLTSFDLARQLREKNERNSA